MHVGKWFDIEYIDIISDISLLIIFLIVCFVGVKALLYCAPIFDEFLHSARPQNFRKYSIPMKGNYSPFTFDIESTIFGYSGIQCTCSSKKDCYVLPAWGVPIFELFKLLNTEWNDIWRSILDNDAEKFSSKCIASNDIIFIPSGETKIMTFKPPIAIDPLKLNCSKSLSRDHYPFVAIMLLANQSDISERMILLLATAVHIKDPIVQTNSTIIGQFLKPINGNVGIVRKTFSTSPETITINDKSIEICIICYERPISIVIIPCCHASVCEECFKLCENCPICRGMNNFFFQLPTENEFVS